jgi:protein-L-isoaspartate(D-aspartate) O-methyltransferase
VIANLHAPRLVQALAATPRERFLSEGPWMIRGAYDTGSRQTDDANPRHVYHDFVVAIDPARNLYNGQPSLIARWLDGLHIREGERVVHIGCATGYYTALIAQMVGAGGQVVAFDVDAALVERAQSNLREWPWVRVTQGDGRTSLPAESDVVLVHAGATHVLDEWLAALRDGGRLLVPLTGTFPGMPAGIGKGMVLTSQRRGDDWPAQLGSMVAIYSLIGLRDESMEAKLGQAFAGGKWTSVKRLRRDAHEQDATCIVHGNNCLSAISGEL